MEPLAKSDESKTRGRQRSLTGPGTTPKRWVSGPVADAKTGLDFQDSRQFALKIRLDF